MKCYNHKESDAVGTCTTCGKALCDACKTEVNGMLRCMQHSVAMPAPVMMQPVTRMTAEVEERLKSPGLAFLFGIAPGVGHLYLGLYQRALMIGGIFAGSIALATIIGPIFVIGIIFSWFFSTFDAFRMAKLINRGAISEDPTISILDTSFRPGQWSMIVGIGLVLVGLFVWADRRWNFDLTFVRENSALVVVALGAWLIWRAMKNKKEADATRAERESDGSYAS